mmetsp:Transcript_17331/g.41068  ORF Transcript_17331/g.41068 Transcript_17331/m.41068 type:complete len:217 (-) Transcript_17331:514-1164(-)
MDEITWGAQYFSASPMARALHVPLTRYVPFSSLDLHRLSGTEANCPCPPPCRNSISYPSSPTPSGMDMTRRRLFAAWARMPVLGSVNSGDRWLRYMAESIPSPPSPVTLDTKLWATSVMTSFGSPVGPGEKLTRSLGLGGVRLPSSAGWATSDLATGWAPEWYDAPWDIFSMGDGMLLPIMIVSRLSILRRGRKPSMGSASDDNDASASSCFFSSE